MITSTAVTEAFVSQLYIYDVEALDPDGDALHYRDSLFYDLIKTAVIRLAFATAESLRDQNIGAAVNYMSSNGIRKWLTDTMTSVLVSRRDMPLSKMLTTRMKDTEGVALNLERLRRNAYVRYFD